MAHIFLGFHRSILDLRFGQENLAALRGLGTVIQNPKDRPLTVEELLEQASDCEIVVSDRLTPGDATFFDNAVNLAAYVRAVTDLNRIDIEAASRNGILVSAAGPTFVPGVTEWTVGQMINLSRHLLDYMNAYRSGIVPDLGSFPRGRQLAEKSAGIIGFGKLGRSLGLILNSLGMRVLAHDPYVDHWPEDITPSDLDTLLRESDFVICLAKLTEETAGFMDAGVFEKMRSSAYFVNPGRGDLVDEAALEQALVSGQIAGAALDVGSGDGDIPTLQLARLPNVLATPHIAPSMDANHAQGRQAVAMVAKILGGEIPEEALNGNSATRLRRFSTAATPPPPPPGNGVGR